MDTTTGLIVMGLVYFAITAQMVLVKALGGLDAVPLILFGICQYLPGLIVIAVVPKWRDRLVQLLTTRPPTMTAVAVYLVTAGTLAVCIALPYLTGQNERALDGATIAEYPLNGLLPIAGLRPVSFILFILCVGPFVHLLNAVGEEILWRGYLLDWLEARHQQAWAWVINGLLWGVWHAPMIMLLGWDFPGHPIAGTIMITVSQVFWSLVLCYVTRRSNSLWPAIIMHAVANAMTIGLFDLLIDHELNLIYSPWGLLGGGLMAAVAAAIFVGFRPAAIRQGAIA